MLKIILAKNGKIKYIYSRDKKAVKPLNGITHRPKVSSSFCGGSQSNQSQSLKGVKMALLSPCQNLILKYTTEAYKLKASVKEVQKNVHTLEKILPALSGSDRKKTIEALLAELRKPRGSK